MELMVITYRCAWALAMLKSCNGSLFKRDGKCPALRYGNCADDWMADVVAVCCLSLRRLFSLSG